MVVGKVSELMQQYEEYGTRLQILKANNPHIIKNFFEKVSEIERIIKMVGEILKDWQVF